MQDSLNPYTPPKITLAEDSIEESRAEIDLAKRWRRFVTCLIDSFLQFILLIGILFLCEVFFGEEQLLFLAEIPDFVLGVLGLVIYYVPQEATTSRTVGKWVTGTKVVDEEGRKPTFWQIVGRTLSRLAPFDALSFLGKDGTGWHDRIPRTYVVRVSKGRSEAVNAPKSRFSI